ncbi:alpha/beta hydrolase [Paenibacillus wenxiniae]|uniref:Alpha/beta hydrolase n=1 Tax=Paenibacillus wenxiniae TaxID=1636843 RepID=A0ABW4RM30_9BACL
MNTSHHAQHANDPNPTPSERQLISSTEVRLRGTMQLDLTSAEGRLYRILVSLPDAPPPPEGYPIIYMLDGHYLFATMLEAERSQSRRTEKTGATASIIVGIGYPSELPNSPERHFDYTLPVPPQQLPASRDGQPWPAHGGADLFLQFIEQVLKPEIECRLPVNQAHQTLLGHSFGGLFTLHALFSSPQSFRNYVAASPSLHWAQPLIADEEQQFVHTIQKQHREQAQTDPHHLLIVAGELECAAPFYMLQNARTLAERLSGLEAYGLHVRFREYPEENHGSVVPSMISAALRTASL